ncbi:hypothetical protein VTK56DRAFT_2430 [Thermocarpiscus australiensis]
MLAMPARGETPSSNLSFKYFREEDNVPSISELEQAHFASSCLGDVTRFAVEGMSYGEKPECLPSAEPVIAAYQANFIPGGLIFVRNFHHYGNDVMGWASFVYRLAENCHSIANKTAPPPWNPGNLDATRFAAVDFPSAYKFDGPTPPARRPLLRENSSLLLRLPRAKLSRSRSSLLPPNRPRKKKKRKEKKKRKKKERKKKENHPTDDAPSALLWRILTRHLAALYNNALRRGHPSLPSKPVIIRPHCPPTRPSRSASRAQPLSGRPPRPATTSLPCSPTRSVGRRLSKLQSEPQPACFLPTL